MKPSKTLLTALTLAGAMTFSVAANSIAAGDRCSAVTRGFDEVSRQSGFAFCTAGTNSKATAHGWFAIATALTDSIAHMDGDCPTAGACTAMASKSSRATNIWSGQVSADFDSLARADHAFGARATHDSRAEAEGAGSQAIATWGSRAYANLGGVAIATNGGCAEAWNGTTAVADGEVKVTGTDTPVVCVP